MTRECCKARHARCKKAHTWSATASRKSATQAQQALSRELTQGSTQDHLGTQELQALSHAGKKALYGTQVDTYCTDGPTPWLGRAGSTYNTQALALHTRPSALTGARWKLYRECCKLRHARCKKAHTSRKSATQAQQALSRELTQGSTQDHLGRRSCRLCHTQSRKHSTADK